MKKIVIGSLILFSMISMVSCQKTQVHPAQTSSTTQPYDFRTDEKFNELFKADKAKQAAHLRIDPSKILEIATKQDQEVRKLAIATLTTNEKVDFWSYVVEYHLSHDHYTADQISLMRDLKNATVTNDFFTIQYLQTVYYHTFIAPIRIQLNKSGISDGKISAAFADGRLVYVEPSAQRPGPDGKKLNCDCGASTIFTMCSSCKATDNCTKKGGCGFMFSYECDGLCPKYLPTNYPLN